VTTETKQSKTWVIAAAALVAFIGVVAWVLSRPAIPTDELAATEPPAEPARPPAAPAPKPSDTPVLEAKVAPVAEEKPEQQPVAADEPVDLFAGEMPDFMADLHARVLEKKFLNVEQQKELYHWGQEHKNDARPQLLLAWDSRNRDWDGFAINVYGIAFRADPRATQDPAHLRDVLQLASKHEVERVEFTEATQIVKTHFGLNALPLIDEELEELNASGQIARATRLSKMRDILRGH
jgi:hypothetical protein